MMYSVKSMEGLEEQRCWRLPADFRAIQFYLYSAKASTMTTGIGLVAEGEGKQSGTWPINHTRIRISMLAFMWYMYTIHTNRTWYIHDTYKHKMVYT